MRSSFEIRRAENDVLLQIVEDRLSHFPYIRELYNEKDIAKIIRKKNSLDNELLSTLVLNSPVYFQLLSNINENLETLYPDGVIDVFKTKLQQWDLNNFRSTVVELYFAAVFKKLGYSIQFEPDLPNHQKSEFLAKKGNITCYVEEKTIHRKETEKEHWISDELFDKLDNIDEPFSLSLEITEHVEKIDVDDIVTYIRERLREEQSITDSFNFSYDKNGIRLVEISGNRLPSKEKGYVSGFGYPGRMTIEWSDIRKKISKGVSQLHPNYPGILVIHPLTIDIDLYDIFNAVFGDLAISKDKDMSLGRQQARILKADKNRRISSIIIHRRKNNEEGFNIENIVIFNRYAENPLSRDFLDFTSDEFKTLEQFNLEIEEAERKKQEIISSLYQYGIEKIADCYKKGGWHVKANHINWDIPEPIFEKIPDIIAKKGKDTVIIHINTYLSLLNRMAQESTLESYARRNLDTRFLLFVVDQDKTIKTERNIMKNIVCEIGS